MSRVAGENQRVVCYYTNWSVYRPGTAKFNPQNINPYLCTHLIYAFGGLTKENGLRPFDKYQDIEQGELINKHRIANILYLCVKKVDTPNSMDWRATTSSSKPCSPSVAGMRAPRGSHPWWPTLRGGSSSSKTWSGSWGPTTLTVLTWIGNILHSGMAAKPRTERITRFWSRLVKILNKWSVFWKENYYYLGTEGRVWSRIKQNRPRKVAFDHGCSRWNRIYRQRLRRSIIEQVWYIEIFN